MATAQGLYTPAPPQPHAVYRGPNMFAPGFFRGFATSFLNLLWRVTRNYNEANFYVSEVQAMQNQAYNLRQKMKLLKHHVASG